MIAAVAVTATPKKKVKNAVVPKAVAARRNKRREEIDFRSSIAKHDALLQKISTNIAEIFGAIRAA